MEKNGPKIEIVSLPSKLLFRTVSYCAILPDGYPAGENFPTLYLLHGLFGRFDNWITNTEITQYARKFPFVIICPEGGDGWYTDSPNLENHFYESYIFEELIPDVERRFKVGAQRKARAVAGLSMGGYGAFKFAFRRPETFCFAASTSGAFHAAGIFGDGKNAWTELKPSILSVFGSEKVRSDNDLFEIAEDFPAGQIHRLPFFYFDCGTQDAFLPFNVKLARIFRHRRIPHQFRRLPGAHDWNYWGRRAQDILRLAAAAFSV